MHWPGRFLSKKAGLIGAIISLILVYFWLSRYLRHDNIAAEGDCIRMHLLKKGIEPAGDLSEIKLAFTGNGFVGVDAIFDKRLMLFSNTSTGAHTFVQFYPMAEVESPFVTKQLVSFTDKSSIARIISCTAVSGKCVCISNSIYAHRVYSGLLIQEINIANPSSSSFSVSFNRKPSQFEQHRRTVPAIFTQASEKSLIAVTCSELPKKTVSLKPKTEENFRFICYVEKTDGAEQEGNNLFSKVSTKFTSFYARNSDLLEKEHLAAWESLSNFNFHISNSKAPNNPLNQPEIDNFKTFLLSSFRAPLLEERQERSSQNNLALESEYCFGGISTMLTPSKLWEDANDLEALLKKIEIWKSTLSHRGCSRIIQKFGAHGLAQSFLLSLTAGLFSSDARRLEFSLNPETELHRNIKVSGLRIGNGGLVSIDFRLDSALKPFVILESMNSEVPLFACTAGCQEAPHLVNKNPISLAIKMTRPSSPILFISEHQTELEMVGKTLHVVEIFEAPAHEQTKIDLHKHGSSQGGLSTIFWLVLISLLVAFHLFLFKLLYSEWANSSAASYSKFNKKVLFQR